MIFSQRCSIKGGSLRRPVCLPAVSFAAGIFFGFYPQLNKFIIIFSICVIALFLIVRHGKAYKFKRVLAGCFAFFIAGSSCFFFHDNKENCLMPLIDKETVIYAQVISVQKKGEEHIQLVVKAVKENEKILVNIYGDFEAAVIIERYGDLAGRYVEISGKPELPAERRNPGTFDYRLHLKAKGISAVMKIMPHDIALAGGSVNVFINAISNIRYDFSQKVSQAMSPESTGIFPEQSFKYYI